MSLTTRERKALDAADDPNGVDRGELAKYGVGEKTIGDLLQRGLLEEFPHRVTGRTLYRTTAAGKAALRESEPPQPARTRPKWKMLKPALRAADLRAVKPKKR